MMKKSKMKKIKCFLASVALVGATSCTEEIIVQNGAEGGSGSSVELTFSASNSEMKNSTETRSLIREGGDILWVANDRISLFANGTNNPFITKDGGVVTNYKGTVSEEADIYYAVYPYNSDATIDGNTISTILYDHQYAEPGSFASGMNLSVSMSDTDTGQDLAFLHSVAWLRVRLSESYNGDHIRSMRMKGNNGEYLAGDVKIAVDPADFSAKVQDTENKAQTIYLNQINSGETFRNGKFYYFVLAPQTFQNGFTLTLVNEDGEVCAIEYPDLITFTESEYHEVTIDEATFKQDEEGCGIQEDGFYHVNSLACLHEWASLVADTENDNTNLGLYFDIDEIDFSEDEQEWPTIGTEDRPYTGTVMGNGVILKNFKIEGNNERQYAGFIGALGAEGVVENITFENPTVTSAYEGDITNLNDDGFVGVVVGLLNEDRTNNQTGGSISNCHIINPKISGAENVGGIVGRSYGRNDAISGCTVSGGTIQGHMFVGGIIGNAEGIIENCHVKNNTSISYHDVKTDARVGGIVGTNNSGQLVACTAYATVEGNQASGLDARYAGGVAGANNGTMIGCAFSGSVSGDYSGALAGESYGDMYGCYAQNATAAALIYKVKSNTNKEEDVIGPTFKACYLVGSGEIIGSGSLRDYTMENCTTVDAINQVSQTMNSALNEVNSNSEYAYGAGYQYETNSGDDAQTFPVKAAKPQ